MGGCGTKIPTPASIPRTLSTSMTRTSVPINDYRLEIASDTTLPRSSHEGQLCQERAISASTDQRSVCVARLSTSTTTCEHGGQMKSCSSLRWQGCRALAHCALAEWPVVPDQQFHGCASRTADRRPGQQDARPHRGNATGRGPVQDQSGVSTVRHHGRNHLLPRHASM